MPVKKEASSENTSYNKLKQLILDREITPDQKMTEAFLAEKLNMSRIPIREAIQLLAHEGFIERAGKGGYQIKRYNEQDIIDLYCYREAMDGMLARLFTERMDSSQLYYLEMNTEVMGEQLQNIDHVLFAKIDMEFHRILARGARNRYMERQHEIILEKVIYLGDSIYATELDRQSSPIDEHDHERTYQQHLEIFKAIKQKDPDKAESAARESVRNGLKKALLVLSRKH